LLGVASLASILGAAFGLTVAARPSVLTNALAVGVSADDTCGRRFFLDLSGGLKFKAEGDGKTAIAGLYSIPQMGRSSRGWIDLSVLAPVPGGLVTNEPDCLFAELALQPFNHSQRLVRVGDNPG
jgi:hypothetical protein